MNTQPDIRLTVEEIDEIVREGMLTGGVPEAEVGRVFAEADDERLAQMRAGVITVMRGMRILGWVVLPPPTGES